MQSIKLNQYTGRRAKTGSLCSDNRGKLQVFVAYCHCHNKVVMDLREAEDFARKWYAEKKKPRNRLLLKRFNKLYLE